MTTSRILAVDDEPKICQFLEVLLQREGYEVKTACNAADALLLAGRERFDLVITDLKMPGMDGFEFVTRLRQNLPDIPVIMVTGFATVETAVNALRDGFDDYVSKPFNIEEMRKVIRRQLDKARARTAPPAAPQPDPGAADMVRTVMQRTLRQIEEKHRRQAESAPASAPQELPATDPELPTGLGQMVEATFSESDLDRLLQSALAGIAERLNAGACSIMTLDGDQLVVRAATGDKAGEIVGARSRLGEGIAGFVAQERRGLVVKNVHEERIVSPAADRVYQTRSLLCCPIMRGDGVLGVINVTERRTDAPFTHDDLRFVSRVADLIAPAVMLVQSERRTEERCADVVQRMVETLEQRSAYLSGHSARVAAYARALGAAAGMGRADIEMLSRAAMLHDVGYLAVRPDLLEKPAKLSDDELAAVREHSAIGERLIEPLPFLDAIRPLVRHHHERMDGAGYPDRLSRPEIPLPARVLAIADAFDAMTTDRPYRRAMTRDAAAAELMASAGSQFDEELARLFCDRVLSSQSQA